MPSSTLGEFSTKVANEVQKREGSLMLLEFPEPFKRPGPFRAQVSPQREELRADREVVLAAVGQNGSALEHASEELGGGGSPEVPARRGWGPGFESWLRELLGL